MQTQDSKKARISIQSITFSDDSSLKLGENDIVVFVGPNNSGKSVALKNINNLIGNDSIENPVVKSISILIYNF